MKNKMKEKNTAQLDEFRCRGQQFGLLLEVGPNDPLSTRGPTEKEPNSGTNLVGS